MNHLGVQLVQRSENAKSLPKVQESELTSCVSSEALAPAAHISAEARNYDYPFSFFCLAHLARARTDTNQNVRLAKQRWRRLPRTGLMALKELCRDYRLSVALGDLLYLDGRWYVSHAGLLRIAQRRECSGIKVECIGRFSDPAAARWAFKATVFKSRDCRG